jgi:hypothetical protein
MYFFARDVRPEKEVNELPDGYELIEIRRDRVRFRGPDETVTLVITGPYVTSTPEQLPDQPAAKKAHTQINSLGSLVDYLVILAQLTVGEYLHFDRAVRAGFDQRFEYRGHGTRVVVERVTRVEVRNLDGFISLRTCTEQSQCQGRCDQ